ncbi:hypothetical protein KFE25_010360 [Diacronema lutheri]|uniref:Integrase catalytic domain-containing protein n=1 Tax=Diacronema lutheri TaxID=2081491 RepID=A0A8J5XNN0_DIALT|nr:hypothetical protein KFE25_010360 [Diacronema lutheri]
MPADDDEDAVLSSHTAAFNDGVERHLAEQKAANSPVLTEEQHDKMLSALIKWAAAERAGDGSVTAVQNAKKEVVSTYGRVVYKWATKYTVLEAGGVSHLVFTYVEGTPLDKVTRPSHTGRVFEDLMRAHVTKGAHRKARGLYAAVKAAHGNSIPHWMCKIFTDSCPHCIKRIARKAVSAGHAPLLTYGLGSRVQIDLIDFQSCPDGDFKYLLNVQDLGTKFYDCRPLTSKRGPAVAAALVDIFTIYGPPKILHSDNGKEFAGHAGNGKEARLDDGEMREVISQIKQLWPDFLMVHGRARHSQSQGAIERLNRTVQARLAAWMSDNNSTQWSVGCRFVRWVINTTVTRATGSSPYKLAFGQEPRVGISDLPIDRVLLEKLTTEVDLNALLGIVESDEEDEGEDGEDVERAADDDGDSSDLRGDAVLGDGAARGAALGEGRGGGLCAALDAARGAARAVTSGGAASGSASGDAVCNTARGAARGTARGAARGTPRAAPSFNDARNAMFEPMPGADCARAASMAALADDDGGNGGGSPTYDWAHLAVKQEGLTLDTLRARHAMAGTFALLDREDVNDGWRRIFVEPIAATALWSIYDEKRILIEKVPFNGEFEGIVAEWGMYYKAPVITADIEQERQGNEMRARAHKIDGAEVKAGSIVQVSVANVDRGKLDPTNATLVVVELVKKAKVVLYRVANCGGVCKDLYLRAYVRPLSNVSPAQIGLDTVLNSWRTLPTVPLRTLATAESATGGQGMRRCSCKGKCNTAKCTCSKAGHRCNSRCHKGNATCTNCYD